MAVFLFTKEFTLVGEPGAVLPLSLRNFETADAVRQEEEEYRLNLPKLEVVEGGAEAAPAAQRKAA
jgi:hypothetical protein